MPVGLNVIVTQFTSALCYLPVYITVYRLIHCTDYSLSADMINFQIDHIGITLLLALRFQCFNDSC